jgi:hypothetical protein
MSSSRSSNWDQLGQTRKRIYDITIAHVRARVIQVSAGTTRYEDVLISSMIEEVLTWHYWWATCTVVWARIRAFGTAAVMGRTRLQIGLRMRWIRRRRRGIQGSRKSGTGIRSLTMITSWTLRRLRLGWRKCRTVIRACFCKLGDHCQWDMRNLRRELRGPSRLR